MHTCRPRRTIIRLLLACAAGSTRRFLTLAQTSTIFANQSKEQYLLQRLFTLFEYSISTSLVFLTREAWLVYGPCRSLKMAFGRIRRGRVCMKSWTHQITFHAMRKRSKKWKPRGCSWRKPKIQSTLLNIHPCGDHPQLWKAPRCIPQHVCKIQGSSVLRNTGYKGERHKYLANGWKWCFHCEILALGVWFVSAMLAMPGFPCISSWDKTDRQNGTECVSPASGTWVKYFRCWGERRSPPPPLADRSLSSGVV